MRKEIDSSGISRYSSTWRGENDYYSVRENTKKTDFRIISLYVSFKSRNGKEEHADKSGVE